MEGLTRRIALFGASTILMASFLLVGCSSSPSDDQKRQLNDLKAEVASLEEQVTAKDKEKADLDKQVAEKNGRVQQCMADKDLVAKMK